MPPVSFSTQRNAGMSSLEPSRMPAWLAPVCDERSVSHSAAGSRRRRSSAPSSGALPSRIASRRTGSARPSISRKRMPGHVGAGARALALGDAARHPQRVLVVVVHPERRRRAPCSPRRSRSAASSASPNAVDVDVVREASRRPRAACSASASSTSRKPEHEHERQPQRGQDRREHRVQHRDGGRDQEGGARSARARRRAAARPPPRRTPRRWPTREAAGAGAGAAAPAPSAAPRRSRPARARLSRSVSSWSSHPPPRAASRPDTPRVPHGCWAARRLLVITPLG